MSVRLVELISPSYRDAQVALHADPLGYGTRSGSRGDRWASTVLGVATHYDCWSLLDYGSGHGSLGRALHGTRLAVREFDPAVKGKDSMPSFADLVASIDVLEHIEPERLDAVLAHLRLLARKAVFLVVSTRPSRATLLDGRNAHLIVEPAEWWHSRVEASGFTVQPVPAIPENVKRPGHAWIAVVTP